MARGLTTRLERLESRTPEASGPVVTIWGQDPGGADAFTCSKRPGEVLTSAELDQLPKGKPGELSIIVVRMGQGE